MELKQLHDKLQREVEELKELIKIIKEKGK
jgi:hypothetical protein